MTNFILLLLALACGTVLFLVFVAAFKYLVVYRHEIRRAKARIAAAVSRNEYVRWKQELSVLRLSFLPGMAPDRVRRLYAKKREPSHGLTGMLMPSALSICLCALCFAGSSFAWFSASQSVSAPVIQAAQYRVETVVAGDAVLSPIDGGYDLQPDTYDVTITAEGSASTGYCILNLSGTQVYTAPIAPGSIMTFTLEIREAAALKVIPQWGSSSVAEGAHITEGETYTHGGT